jgi:hypothetical protein
MIRRVTSAHALYVVGAAIEALGIVLVASPDLVPGAVRFAGWLRPRLRAIEHRVRSLLRLPVSVTLHLSPATAKAGGSLTLSALTAVRDGATLVEKVEFLLGRDREAQEARNELSERVAAIGADAPRRLAQLRVELEAHVADELAAKQADYRAVRIGGTVALVVGLGLATWANFLS